MPLDQSALRKVVRFALIAMAGIATGCDSSTPAAPAAQATSALDPLRAPLERLGMQGIARGDLANTEVQRALRQLATTPCNSQAMGALRCDWPRVAVTTCVIGGRSLLCARRSGGPSP